MNNTNKGLAAVHSSVLIFGLTALFSKLITLSSLEITLLRSIFAALAIAIILFYGRKTFILSCAKDYAIATALGILLAIHWITYFHAMQISSIAIGVIALYTFPIITVFLEPLFNRSKPRIQDVISAIVVLFGIYLLIPELSINNEVTLGILWGVFSAFCFALRNIIQGRYFNQYPASQSMMYQTIITFIILLPFSFQIIPDITNSQWGLLFILGIIFTALPHTLFAFSLIKLKAKTVSLIACIQVVYATFFAALILGEKPELLTIIGGAIIVSVAIFESLHAGNKNNNRCK